MGGSQKVTSDDEGEGVGVEQNFCVVAGITRIFLFSAFSAPYIFSRTYCNNSRISDLIGSIFQSRLFCFSQVRFAGIEMRPAEAESVNS